LAWGRNEEGQLGNAQYGTGQRELTPVLAKQPQPQVTEADIQEIIKWLEQLWLTEDELRKMVTQAEWQEFIERVKIRY